MPKPTPILHGSIFCPRCGEETELHAAPGPRDDPRFFLRSEALFAVAYGKCRECRTAAERTATRAERDRWEPAPNQRPAVTVPGERRAA